MKKLLALLLLLPGLVWAQCAPQFSPNTILSAAALNVALATPCITGGTINGAPIGATTPSTGAFTTLSTTGAPTFTVPVPIASGGTGTTMATGTGSVVLSQAPQFTATGGYINQIGPYTGTWVNGVFSGVFEYLEANSAFNSRGKPDGIGLFAATRSSTGSGGASAANIGMASFAYNDYVGGSAGVWGFYTTVARASSNTGVTHGYEIDVANMGPLVSVTPYTINPAGLTEGLRLAAGGEIATNNTVNASSAALMIVRNDANATPHASFDKGIVFDANALTSPVALALPTGSNGNAIQWYTATGASGGYINNTISATANATSLAFQNAGAFFTGNANQALLLVPNVASAVNYLTVNAAATGSGPSIVSTGTDANIGLTLTPKGTGQVYINGNLGSGGNGVLPVYNTTGANWNTAHVVIGNVALSAGSATVALSGTSVYTAAGSYFCIANDATGANAVKVGQTSGTSITFTGTGTDTVQFMCAGN